MNCSEKAGKMYRFFQYVSSFLVQYSKTKKACPCGQVFFCFLSSNEVKSRFEPLYLATMPLTTSICFFSTRSLCASDAAARICKSSRLPISNVLPQRRCRRQSIYCTCLFFLHVIQPKFKRKKHLPHKFYNKKAFFTQKNLFFTQFCFPARFFKPSLSVKNIYHHKFYNKKAFFTQKNLFFTQFCYVLFI